jgi:hypothetical protein
MELREELMSELPGSQEEFESMRAAGQDIVAMLERSVNNGEEALDLANYFRNKLESLGLVEILSEEDLKAFAKAFPHWSVSVGIANGEAVKTYSRTIVRREMPIERRSGGTKEHDTYLRLADAEHSDLGLEEILGGYSGDYFNGKYYVISSNSTETGPLNYGDVQRVKQAEDYLIAEGYIIKSDQEPAAA